MRTTPAVLMEWRAPHEAGAQAVLLRAAATAAETCGLLSLWFWDADPDELVLYATTQDMTIDPADA